MVQIVGLAVNMARMLAMVVYDPDCKVMPLNFQNLSQKACSVSGLCISEFDAAGQ